MKKALSLIICLAFVLAIGITAFAEFDLKSLSDEELFALETSIQAEKISRGIAKSADVPQGSYIIGKDIPAGSYSVSTESILASFVVKNADGSTCDTKVLSSGSPIGKIDLTDGQQIEISSSLVFTVYTGSIIFSDSERNSNSQSSETSDSYTATDALNSLMGLLSNNGDAASSDVDTSNATMGEKNALSSAKDYLSFMSFSYSGLIEQLEYEGYSTAEATYAADNCGADWNQQAVKSAKEYLSYMSFSKSGLIEQLQYEGFTYEQALYGAEANGY